MPNGIRPFNYIIPLELTICGFNRPEELENVFENKGIDGKIEFVSVFFGYPYQCEKYIAEQKEKYPDAEFICYNTLYYIEMHKNKDELAYFKEKYLRFNPDYDKF